MFLRGPAARLVDPPSVTGYFGQLYSISGWTSLPWLHTLRQPTLVLAGDDDPIVPLINGRILAWRIPTARLHVVRGGGHLFLLERPSELATVIAEFVGAVNNPSRLKRLRRALRGLVLARPPNSAGDRARSALPVHRPGRRSAQLATVTAEWVSTSRTRSPATCR